MTTSPALLPFPNLDVMPSLSHHTPALRDIDKNTIRVEQEAPPTLKKHTKLYRVIYHQLTVLAMFTLYIKVEVASFTHITPHERPRNQNRNTVNLHSRSEVPRFIRFRGRNGVKIYKE